MTSTEIEAALNDLFTIQQIGKVSVSTTNSLDGNFNLSIIFVSSAASLPDVEADSAHESFIRQDFVLNVTEFDLGFGLRKTDTLTPTTPIEVIQRNVSELFGAKCVRSELGEIYFVETYEESNKSDDQAGTRDGSVLAVCGAYSGRNPSWLFSADESIPETTTEDLSVAKYPSTRQYKYVSL